MDNEERRAYSREWARKRRQAKRDAANTDALRCAAMLANRKKCRTPLQSRFVDGVTVPFCPTCDRKARGICIACDEPVIGTAGKALRCPLHAKLERLAAQTRYKRRNRAKLRAKWRKHQRDPVKRAATVEYKRLYRQSKPGKVAQWKREYYERNREKVRAYMAEYRRTHAESRALRERDRYYRDHPVRPTPTCRTCSMAIAWTPKPGGAGGRPPAVCDACCAPSERKRRVACRARRAAIDAAQSPVAPRTLVPPAKPARYLETGERLCLGAGCDVVVAGRSKLCATCRATQRTDARAIISARINRAMVAA